MAGSGRRLGLWPAAGAPAGQVPSAAGRCSPGAGGPGQQAGASGTGRSAGAAGGHSYSNSYASEQQLRSITSGRTEEPGGAVAALGKVGLPSCSHPGSPCRPPPSLAAGAPCGRRARGRSRGDAIGMQLARGAASWRQRHLGCGRRQAGTGSRAGAVPARRVFELGVPHPAYVPASAGSCSSGRYKYSSAPYLYCGHTHQHWHSSTAGSAAACAGRPSSEHAVAYTNSNAAFTLSRGAQPRTQAARCHLRAAGRHRLDVPLRPRRYTPQLWAGGPCGRGHCPAHNSRQQAAAGGIGRRAYVHCAGVTRFLSAVACCYVFMHVCSWVVTTMHCCSGVGGLGHAALGGRLPPPASPAASYEFMHAYSWVVTTVHCCRAAGGVGHAALGGRLPPPASPAAADGQR